MISPMNEIFFLIHTLLMIGFVFGALRLGKSGLVALIALQGVLANLFVIKQISLFGFSVTGTDVFAIGGIFSLNLLQEYFGKEAAREAVKISFLTLLFFAFMAQMHLLYFPTEFDQTQGAFQEIFSHSMRIVAASIGTFYLVQRFDVWFFGRLKGVFPFRVALSLLVSQALDTLLFSFLGLYGLVESLFDIFWVSFMVKCLIIAGSSPFVIFAKRIVKREIPV